MARLNINGKEHDVQVEDDTPLLWVIREQVGLTGTKYGCGVAACGACSVHINGEVRRSCVTPGERGQARRPHRHDRRPLAEQLAPGAESLGSSTTCRSAATASPARSWPPRRCCAKTKSPSDADIDAAMTNICRCGTYQRIRAAIHTAGQGQSLRGEETQHENRRHPRKSPNPLPPQVHHQLGRSPAADSPSASTLPFGRHRRTRRRRSAAAAPKSTHWVVIKPDDTRRDPRRARRDGPGHAHRPRAARRRRARVRLEQGHASSRSPPARTSRASASGATCPPAAAAASAPRRTTCARAAPPRA